MADHTLFVGLDVHKRTIAVATAPDTAGTSCTYYGTIANTPDALRRLCKKLAAPGVKLHFTYEDGVIPASRRSPSPGRSTRDVSSRSFPRPAS
jgi:hypothetical protein